MKLQGKIPSKRSGENIIELVSLGKTFNMIKSNHFWLGRVFLAAYLVLLPCGLLL